MIALYQRFFKSIEQVLHLQWAFYKIWLLSFAPWFHSPDALLFGSCLCIGVSPFFHIELFCPQLWKYIQNPAACMWKMNTFLQWSKLKATLDGFYLVFICMPYTKHRNLLESFLICVHVYACAFVCVRERGFEMQGTSLPYLNCCNPFYSVVGAIAVFARQ